MRNLINLLVILVCIGYVTTITLDGLEKTFELDKCIQGSLTTLNQQSGIATMSSQVIQSSYPTGISQEELKLFNISRIEEKSSMSKLNELAHHHDIEYNYKLISEEGPPHNRLFKVRLMLGDEAYEAEAKSKKKAQQYAASIALQNTKYSVKSTEVNEVKISALTPTVKLNNIAAKLGMAVKYAVIDSVEGKMFTYKDPNLKSGHSYLEKLNNSIYHQQHQHQEIENSRRIRGPYNVEVTVDTMAFIGYGSTVQDARHDAAQKAIHHLKQTAIDKENACAKEGSEEECRKMKESIKSSISKIYEAGQKHKIEVKFEIINELGPPHKKIFVTRCVLGDFITEAEGHSKKESKRLAAEKMLENLTYLPDNVDDSNDIVNALKTKKKRKKKKKLMKESQSDDGSLLDDLVDSTWNLFDNSARDTVNGKLNTESSASTGDPSNDEHKSSGGSPKTTKTRNVSQGNAKNTLLSIGSSLGFEVHFHDLGGKLNEFHTLVSIGVHPPYLCYGKAASRDESNNRASVESMKLLFRNGIEDKLYNKVKDKEYIRFILNEYIYPDAAMSSSKDNGN